ncbi:MAG: hypothetical protein GF364_09890 [Candidatus Lokiarchaeota archaeon]|nr:hypothetical protein [Candidatus Lokiarchaeota archaeon]
MVNVLAPMCRRRFLINVRILAGMDLEELPKFCYSQVVSNVKRYIDKKTTLYTPIDTLIYNQDFFELFFRPISSELFDLLKNKKLKEADALISRSRLPAIPSNSKSKISNLLRNILKRDKMIKEGSFIYDFDVNYFVIWLDNSLYIADLKKGYTICNAHKKRITSPDILRLILPIYAKGKEFSLDLEINEENNISKIKIVISGEKLIKIDDELRNQKFSKITDEIGPKFPRTTFNFNTNADLEIMVELDETCTYDDLNDLFNTLSSLSEVEYIDLLRKEEY